MWPILGVENNAGDLLTCWVMQSIWQNQPATYIESVIGSHQQYLELSVMVHWRVKYWKGLQPFNIGSNQPEKKNSSLDLKASIWESLRAGINLKKMFITLFLTATPPTLKEGQTFYKLTHSLCKYLVNKREKSIFNILWIKKMMNWWSTTLARDDSRI